MDVVRHASGNVLSYGLSCIQHLSEHYGEFEVFTDDFISFIIGNIFQPMLNICRPAMAIIIRLVSNENQEESLRMLQLIMKMSFGNISLIQKLVERLVSHDHDTLLYTLQLLNAIYKSSILTKTSEVFEQIELYEARKILMVETQ